MSDELEGLMSRDRVYYIETAGSAETNKMIADALAEQSCVCEQYEVHTNDGIKKAWECPNYTFLENFEAAAKSLAGTYRVWLLEGKSVTARHLSGNIFQSESFRNNRRSKRSQRGKRTVFEKLKEKLGPTRQHKIKIQVSIKTS